MKKVNWKQIGLYAVLGVLTLMMGSSGIGKLVSTQEWLIEWDKYGYPLWFMYAIGILQVVGSIMLWLQKTRFWAAALFAVIMVGAVFTHINTGEYIGIPSNVVLLVLSAVVMWANRNSIWSMA